MKRSDYLRDKTSYIICHSSVLIVTAAILSVLLPAGARVVVVFVGVTYLFGALAPLETEFRKKRAFYNQLAASFESLDRKNLVAEIVSRPDFFEGILLYDLLKASNKAYLEEINSYKILQAEYREYVEMWVHEIKTPIASSKLIAQNNKSDVSDSIFEELEKIEGYVEQTLFYARSNAVENDYVIRPTRVEKPVFNVLKRDSKQLIASGISVSTLDLDVTVFSDAKWVEFILHQLINNAVKYAAGKAPRLDIEAQETENSCILSVSDNGIGIPDNELPRIFDKGFTGSNGRLRGKSTGMGLYICKRLCDKLGISISAKSVPGEGTTISLVFPISSMTYIV